MITAFLNALTYVGSAFAIAGLLLAWTWYTIKRVNSTPLAIAVFMASLFVVLITVITVGIYLDGAK